MLSDRPEIKAAAGYYRVTYDIEVTQHGKRAINMS